MKYCKKIQLATYFFITPILAFAKSPLIATGHYFDGKTQSPLMAISHDQGNSWIYPESINQHTQGAVGPVECSGQRCIAAGNKYDEHGMSIPMLVNSDNEGLNWTFIDIFSSHNILPNNFRQGWFNSISCNETVCLVGGYYKDDSGIQRPLLVQSEQDDSAQWKGLNTAIQSALPQDFYRGELHSVSCTKDTCIVVGMYQTKKSENEYPLLLTSQDNGNSWQTPLNNKDFQFPNDFQFGNFYATKCFENNCIAVGEYQSVKQISQPFLVTSQDRGKTWIAPQQALPQGFDSGYFLSTACGKTHCVAAGVFTKQDHDYPLLAYSQDGIHWTYPENLTNASLPTGFQDGSFMKAACNDNSCMAAGVYYSLEGAHPLIASSQQKGLEWHYPASAQTSNPMALAGDGLYLNVSCHAFTCFAVGDFLDDTFYSEKNPLLSISHDGGNNWFYPESINNKSILPPLLMNGGFKNSN